MKYIFRIVFLMTLQSCYFGEGLVEKKITDNYFLFANNRLDEMSIWYNAKEHYNLLIVPKTVFAVGENGEFIIAKSHPNRFDSVIEKNVTYYHIIEVKKRSSEQSPSLTLEQFEQKRIELNIPNNLVFDTIFKELE